MAPGGHFSPRFPARPHQQLVAHSRRLAPPRTSSKALRARNCAAAYASAKYFFVATEK
jgi:hypothetical protein